MIPMVKPIGVGDLLVVLQKLERYSAHEIAHIENAMGGETRERTHRRLTREENTFEEERERTEETSRDLQTTERFELQEATEKTIASESSLSTGVSASASYGPFTATAYLDFSTGQSESESQRNASNYAREVTERAVSRVKERVRERREAKLFTEVEETNLHRFENTSGSNRAGLYYWLNKTYRMKTVRYGKRVWWRFVFGSPAAFWLFYQHHHLQNAVLPEEPEMPFFVDIESGEERPLEVGDIDEENWQSLVSRFGAEGVQPPPKPTLRISRHIQRENQDQQFFNVGPSDMEVPAGYVARRVWIAPDVGYQGNGTVTQFVFVANGRTSWEFDFDGDSTSNENISNIVETAVDNIVGRFPVGLMAAASEDIRIRNTYVRILVECHVVQSEMNKWRMSVFSAIQTTYMRKRSDYEESIAALQVAGGVEIEGRNPEINRKIEREELKKGCITLLTGYRFNGDAMVTQNEGPGVSPPDNFPEIDLDATRELAREIDFFEKAFDWANMTYEFYGPHWSPKDTWLDVYPLTDPDPQFEAFKRAGAVAVMVPATVEFTAALLYFQLTGHIWEGQDVPLFSSDPEDTFLAPGVEDNRDEAFLKYQAFVRAVEGDQLRDDLPKDIEVSSDDPDTWLETVPTSLVYLSEDTNLPNFTDLSDGGA